MIKIFTEVFPCFFLSCKANARVKLAKTGHGPHTITLFVLFGCYLCCSMYCLCVNVYCHRVTTQLQLINISYSVLIFVEKIYKMQHFECSGTPVLCIGRTVLKR
jgi:hypothetical protein